MIMSAVFFVYLCNKQIVFLFKSMNWNRRKRVNRNVFIWYIVSSSLSVVES